jgi:radical SAM superfamily enzyme YgiQ (UPF0313 family)
MAMRVLFIWSNFDGISWKKPLKGEIHFGISYISSLLKKHGHQTKLLPLVRRYGDRFKRQTNDVIRLFNPQLICFTAVSSEYNFILNVAKYIRHNYPGIFLLVGGTHVSLNPANIPLDIFHALCIGEGEYPTLELVSQMAGGQLGAIPNLWLKQGASIEQNNPRPFLQDLDALPFPDRDIYEEWIHPYYLKNPQHAFVLMSRGCPYNCSYCCNHALRKTASGKYVRFRSVANVIEEIRTVCARYPSVVRIFLESETLGAQVEWTKQLGAALAKFNEELGRPIAYSANLRISSNVDYESLFSHFQRSNIDHIYIGLESGSERIRKDVLRRVNNNEDIIAATNLAKKKAIKVSFYNLVGLPGETIHDFFETVRMNRLCQPETCFTSIYHPYPGTDLYRSCMERGLIEKGHEINTQMERIDSCLTLPNFPRNQINKCFDWFEYYVYKDIKPKRILLTNVVKNKLRRYAYLLYIYKKIQLLKITIKYWLLRI